MTPEQSFYIFCIEAYKDKNNLKGPEVISKFKKYNVFDFLFDFYDILHTQSMDYVVAEIEEFITSKK